MTRRVLRVLFFTSLSLSVAAIAQQDSSSDQRGFARGDKKPPAFNAFDTNNDGLVSLDEFSAFGNPPHGNASDIFNEIDSDKDGFITQQEMRNHRPPRPPREQ